MLSVPLPTVDGTTAIATLRAGDELHGVFACTRKDRLVSRAGSPYLALELRDRSGAIAARVFRDADLHAGRFERGDLVRVRGRVERFRDELQVEVAGDRPRSRRRTPIRPPSCPSRCATSTSSTASSTTCWARSATPASPRCWRELVGADAMRAALRGMPCTRAGHHAYLGGLLEHTVAVGTLAVEACALHPRLDQDLLLTAALVHDLGRTREFTLGAEIGLTDEGRLLGHVELSLRLLGQAAAASGLDDARHLAVAHCVLTHHGPEAAPGRRFGSAEAVALHRLNALDAGVKAALTPGLG